MNYQSDIIIIGSGITGCAVARELSRFSASVAVLDRGSDLAEGATTRERNHQIGGHRSGE